MFNYNIKKKQKYLKYNPQYNKSINSNHNDNRSSKVLLLNAAHPKVPWSLNLCTCGKWRRKHGDS